MQQPDPRRMYAGQMRTEAQIEAQRAYQRAYKARRKATDPDFRERLRQGHTKYNGRRRADPARRAADNAKRAAKHRDGVMPDRPAPAVCECCGQPPRSSYSKLVVDHCHDTKTFRGWLCDQCNTAAGMIGDSAEGARKLLTYLSRFEQTQ